MQESGKAKYTILMEELKQKILSGEIRQGDRIPSENELSVSYGVSRHTVRKALAILINEGYITAEHGRGTFCSDKIHPARNSKNIAVITTYISDYIFPRLIQGMDRVLTEQGYSIILKNTGNSRQKEAQCLEDILTKDIDGLIIEPSKSQILCKNIHLYERLDELQIPYVFIQGSYPQMKDKPTILMDDEKGCCLLTKYLIDLGHRHIVGIFKADDSQGAERHKGYAKALQEAGLPYVPDQVVWFHTEDRKTKPSVMIGMMLEQQQEIDAIVCYNDQIAAEVLQALEAAGKKVPEDISVTGYDNSAYAQMNTVGLTTIAHPQEKLGEMAAQLLLELIQGAKLETDNVRRMIEPELIIRQSCKSRKK